MTIKEGDTETLKCNATGRPTPTLLWRREGNAILPGGGILFMVCIDYIIMYGQGLIKSTFMTCTYKEYEPIYIHRNILICMRTLRRHAHTHVTRIHTCTHTQSFILEMSFVNIQIESFYLHSNTM